MSSRPGRRGSVMSSVDNAIQALLLVKRFAGGACGFCNGLIRGPMYKLQR